MLNLSKKTFLALNIFGISAFLLANTTTGHAAGTKIEQIAEMAKKIQNSESPKEWPIRFSIITDTTGPLKVWLGGQDFRLNATKGRQHYLTYNQIIPAQAPIFEVKTLIGDKRVVCNTAIDEQLDGSITIRSDGSFLEAIRITISGNKCQLKPAYRKLALLPSQLRDRPITTSDEEIDDTMGNMGQASQNMNRSPRTPDDSGLTMHPK